jgi:hypothetical protein
MKKHVYAIAAVASLLAGGVFAQATDPRFTGVQPGYGTPEQIYGNSGWTVDQAYGGNGNAYGYGSALGGVLLSDGRWVPNYSSNPNYSQYARTRRDRDGDGVPNWNDRYPDDPRYR